MNPHKYAYVCCLRIYLHNKAKSLYGEMAWLPFKKVKLFCCLKARWIQKLNFNFLFY